MGLRTGSVSGSITFGGLASGIPTNDIIDQVLELERRPIDLLEGQKETFEEKLSILQDLNSLTLTLRDALRGLDNLANVRLSSTPSATDEFSQFRATSSDATIASATASAAASPGSLSIEVSQLAAAEREVSQGYTDLTDTVGTGNFRITVAGSSTDITIDSSNNTLAAFVDAINDSGANVRAFLLNDGSATPHRIVIQGLTSGSTQTVDLAAGTTLSGGTATPSFIETQSAQDAQIFLDPGASQITVLSTTNKFSNLVPGLTLDVSKVSSSTVNITVGEDLDAMVESISALVRIYNEINTLINEQSRVDPTTNRGGPLIGDSTLLSLKRQLASVIASQIGSGAIQSPTEIGLSLDSAGELSLDETTLRAELSSRFDDVKSFFAGIGSFSDQLRRIADTFVDPVDGQLLARIEGSTDSIGDLTQSIADAEDRLETIEANLIRQFTALERIVSNLQQQGLFLNQFILASLGS